MFNTAIYSHLKPETKKARSKDDIHGGRRLKFSEMLEKSASGAGALGPIKELIPSEEALAELMDAVHSTGSDLKERPFPDEILQYKRAVRNFVNYVVENGYEVSQVQGLKKKIVSHGETKWKDTIYHQVKVIDQKLEELAGAILSGQSTILDRVSKLDEITGLLVDLTITGAIKERDG